MSWHSDVTNFVPCLPVEVEAQEQEEAEVSQGW